MLLALLIFCLLVASDPVKLGDSFSQLMIGVPIWLIFCYFSVWCGFVDDIVDFGPSVGLFFVYYD